MDFESLGKQLVSNYLFYLDRGDSVADVLYDIIIQSLPCGYRVNGVNVMHTEFKELLIEELRELV